MLGKKLTLFLLILAALLNTGVSACAQSDMQYIISEYDVNVRINTDGSMDITENIIYTSLGSYNNAMVMIDMQEGEEIEIKKVYILQKNGYVECKGLSEGQWNVNAFSGTYSVTDELGLVRLKVYGNFSNSRGSIVVQYGVKNAVKRYNDIAEYRRKHIFESWEGRISNVNITVSLPMAGQPSSIKPFLHGVLVGSKKVENDRTVSFNIPNTVPGEYVEARIAFPQDIVFNADRAEDTNFLETVLREEEEYNESDKSELLKARENAAKEAGRKAWADKMNRRVKNVFTVISLLTSALGLYILWKIQKKFHQLKDSPVPADFRNIEELSPAEVRLISSNGKIGGRGVLGSLFSLASRGYLDIGIKQENDRPAVIVFKIADKKHDDDLPAPDVFLLGWIADMLDEKEEFDPGILLVQAQRNDSAKKLKKRCDEWEKTVLDYYSDRNILGTELLIYRNIGLLTGTVLFFLGVIIPIFLSIWAGYSMLPVGIILLLYSLRIRKHTDYGAAQVRVWKELKQRFKNNCIALDGLPGWMSGGISLLGYQTALGTDPQLSMVKAALSKGGGVLTEYVKEQKESGALTDLIQNTVKAFDIGLSSVQDAV